jgi:hypothetical protein
LTAAQRHYGVLARFGGRRWGLRRKPYRPSPRRMGVEFAVVAD